MPLTHSTEIIGNGRSVVYREKAGRPGTAMPFFQYYNHGRVREIRRARVPVSAKGVGPWLPRKKKGDRCCCCQGKKGDRSFLGYGFTESGQPDAGGEQPRGEARDEVVYRVPQLVEK